MSPTDLTTRPSRPRQRIPIVAIGLVLAAAAAVALLALLRDAVSTESVVSEITIVNDTPYGVDVDVRAGDSHLLLGRALPQHHTVRHEVLDAGDHWVFSFERGGVPAGRVERSREQLEHDDWHVAVPGSVTDRLAEAGQREYPGEGNR
jgi:hypothetical protein